MAKHSGWNGEHQHRLEQQWELDALLAHECIAALSLRLSQLLKQDFSAKQ